MESYKLINTSSMPHTKAARVAAPGRAHKKLFLGGSLRVVSGTPTIVSEEVLQLHIVQIKEKLKSGELEVRTLDGRLVNLEDLKPGEGAPTPKAPDFPLDSAKNDKNEGIGENLAQFPGGIPVGSLSPTGGEGIPGPLGENEVADAQRAEHEATDDELVLDDPAADPDGELTDIPSDTAVSSHKSHGKKGKKK